VCYLAGTMKRDLAVIFDMDGVLVDTYAAHYESWQRMARRDGLDFTREDFAATFGRTSREIIAHFWGDGRYSEAQMAELDDLKEAALREIIAADFPAMPGARELLDELHASAVKLAVGSSGPAENVDLVLERLDARRLFDAIVTADDVTRGKPDPQVFLIAAEKLAIAPQRCVVVEDARQGVEAAKAAGMSCVGMLSTGRTAESLRAADMLISSLGELSADVVRNLIP